MIVECRSARCARPSGPSGPADVRSSRPDNQVARRRIAPCSLGQQSAELAVTRPSGRSATSASARNSGNVALQFLARFRVRPGSPAVPGGTGRGVIHDAQVHPPVTRRIPDMPGPPPAPSSAPGRARSCRPAPPPRPAASPRRWSTPSSPARAQCPVPPLTELCPSETPASDRHFPLMPAVPVAKGRVPGPSE